MSKIIQEQFDKNGYYLAKGLFSQDKLEYLEQEFDRVLQILSASEEDNNGRWDSAALTKLEANSKPASAANTQLQTSITHSHMIHRFSAAWGQAMFDPALLEISRQILGENIVLHHNKLFHKPGGHGAGFPVHQDWSYFPMKRDSMIAAVVHLTSATDEMGCIRVFPGSHKLGRMNHSAGTEKGESFAERFPLEESIAIEAEPGDVLFFHYFTLHASKPNLSNKERKTVLIQMHAGEDQPEDREIHPYDQLVLSGINPHMSRSDCNRI